MPRWVSYTVSVVCLLAFVASIATFISQRMKMGSRYKFSDKESVNYSGTATEAEAKTLAESLKKSEYFNGTSSADVLLSRGEEGTVVSFVVKEGKWDDAGIVSAFVAIGESAASALDGKPFKIRLLDSKLNTKKEVAIDKRRLQFSDKEQVLYNDSIPAATAQALAEALQKADYFNGSAPAVVILSKDDNGVNVGFVVQQGSWDKPEVFKGFEEIGGKVAGAVGGKPIMVQLLDEKLNPRRAMKIQ